MVGYVGGAKGPERSIGTDDVDGRWVGEGEGRVLLEVPVASSREKSSFFY